MNVLHWACLRVALPVALLLAARSGAALAAEEAPGKPPDPAQDHLVRKAFAGRNSPLLDPELGGFSVVMVTSKGTVPLNPLIRAPAKADTFNERYEKEGAELSMELAEEGGLSLCRLKAKALESAGEKPRFKLTLFPGNAFSDVFFALDQQPYHNYSLLGLPFPGGKCGPENILACFSRGQRMDPPVTDWWRRYLLFRKEGGKVTYGLILGEAAKPVSVVYKDRVCSLEKDGGVQIEVEGPAAEATFWHISRDWSGCGGPRAWRRPLTGWTRRAPRLRRF